MNKKMILNLITLVITAFLLIFVINAWYVSNSTATVSNVTGTTANDGFTLDLERGKFINKTEVDTVEVYNWEWTSTKDLSINNMEPGDAFFFRFKVTPTKNGTYRVSLGNIKSSIQKNGDNDVLVRTQDPTSSKYYVTFNSTRLFEMDSSTTLNIYNSKQKTDENKLGTLYTYANNHFSLDYFKVENVFRFYNFGQGNTNFNQDDTIPSGKTGVTLNSVSYQYTANSTEVFYVYFALEFNNAASEVTYLHNDGTVKKDSNLYLCQVLTIGQFELVLL